MKKTLKQYLEDWQSLESAAFYIMVVMGLATDDTPERYQKFRHLIETNNPLSELVYPILNQMIEIGILDEDTEHENGERVRWTKTLDMRKEND